MDHNEASTEEFLLRIVPNLASQWEGATPQEIAAIEGLSPRSLPPFYRWFLSRMGRSMGPMTYPTLDFSAGTILRCYAEDDFLAPSDRYLLIGYESDEEMPLHVFYDLDCPARDDALVLKSLAEGGELYPGYETFREQLLWGEALRFLVHTRPHVCRGTLNEDSGDVFEHLDPVLAQLGFHQPVAMGRFCRIYERQDAVMLCSGRMVEGNKFRSFNMGAPTTALMREILGTVALKTKLVLETSEWSRGLWSAG